MKAHEKGYYDQMVTLIRTLFEYGLKTNSSLEFIGRRVIRVQWNGEQSVDQPDAVRSRIHREAENGGKSVVYQS